MVRLCRHGQSLGVNVASVLQITDAVPRAQLAVPIVAFCCKITTCESHVKCKPVCRKRQLCLSPLRMSGSVCRGAQHANSHLPGGILSTHAR